METKTTYSDDTNTLNWGHDGTGIVNCPMKNIKRTTKTIEKWGPEGEYLGKEVITTDEENIQVQDWSSGAIITWGNGITTDTTHYNPDILSTFTAQN